MAKKKLRAVIDLWKDLPAWSCYIDIKRGRRRLAVIQLEADHPKRERVLRAAKDLLAELDITDYMVEG